MVKKSGINQYANGMNRLTSKHYLGDLVVGGLLVSESRIVATRLLENMTDTEWKYQFEVENILQKPSRYTSTRYAHTIRKRFEPLGSDFIRALTNAEEPDYLQMLMLAVLLHAPILVDFIRLVVIEQRRLYQTTLPKDVWGDFIATQQQKIPALKHVSPATLHKVGTNIVRILVEGRYLNSNRQKIFQPVYLLPTVRPWLVTLGHPDLESVIECTI